MDLETLAKAGISISSYDREVMIQETLFAPQWIHFGVGNIFRGFIADIQEELLDKGLSKTGIIAVEAYDEQIITLGMQPYDNISIGVILGKNGIVCRKAIRSIAQALTLAQYDRLCKHFENPSLQFASLTITEKGYSLRNKDGEYLTAVANDIKNGPNTICHSLMGLVTSLIYKRYLAGKLPIAMLSLDNCSSNGMVLKKAVLKIAEEWNKNGFVCADFVQYIIAEKEISFPWSMIDRITPSPSPIIAEQLQACGIPAKITKTDKNTEIACFVNTEECHYLVIEDNFPNGRPPLEEAGVLFANRETVEKCESMKVYTCLNPIHTALAVFGCLLGYTSIAKEMQDSELSVLAEKLGLIEMLPVAVNPVILNPNDFLNDVLYQRFPNVFMPDTPQRIATDTSVKMPIRYGNAIAAHYKKGDAHSLRIIPLVIAGWCRYLVGINDEGKSFTPSPDPNLPMLKSIFEKLTFGATFEECVYAVKATLSVVSLGCKEEMQSTIARNLCDMLHETGAIRNTLRKILG